MLREWPEGGPPLAWQARGLGEGHSAVAVAAGRIYVMGDEDGSSHVRALDEATGEILWSTALGQAGGGVDTDPNRTGTRCTPTVDGNRLYVLGQYGELACLTTDGDIVWRKNLVDDFGGTVAQWGFTESPLIDGEKLICTPGGPQGTLLALDKQTGEPIWQSEEWTEPADYASPIVAEIGGVRHYIQLTATSVAGVAAADGRLLWKAPRPDARIVIPTPIERDGMVYVASGYGVGCHMFRVTPPATPAGRFSVELVYANRDMKNHHGGVILLGDHLYGSNDPGILTCMDFTTGEVVWQDRSVGKGSITIADGRIYLRSEQPPGEMALVEATPEEYHLISTFIPPEGSGKSTWAHPVVANGRLYLRDQDVLYAFDVRAR